MQKEKQELLDRMQQYDKWVEEGKIPKASRIIPVKEALDSLQWILPTNQAVEILKNSKTLALKQCCCHEIQIMKLFNRPDFVSHSDYIATFVQSNCISCGECIRRCKFGAFEAKDGISYNSEKCYGCGLCSTT